MKALFIDRDYITAKSPLSGNIDPDNLMQYIDLAQDIHIQQNLGTDLYNKLMADVIADTLTGNYEALVNNYVKPMLLHFAIVEYLHYAAFNITQGGIFRHSPENATAADKSDVDWIIEKQRKTATFYVERFTDYMCNYSHLFPEYTSNSNGDMKPNRSTNYTPWVL
jgi:hypothetical protein